MKIRILLLASSYILTLWFGVNLKAANQFEKESVKLNVRLDIPYAEPADPRQKVDIYHVADHPDTSAQAERLEAVLKDAGIPARRFAAKETNHSKLNEDLGLPDDPPTKAFFEFADEALKK